MGYEQLEGVCDFAGAYRMDIHGVCEEGPASAGNHAGAHFRLLRVKTRPVPHGNGSASKKAARRLPCNYPYTGATGTATALPATFHASKPPATERTSR